MYFKKQLHQTQLFPPSKLQFRSDDVVQIRLASKIFVHVMFSLSLTTDVFASVSIASDGSWHSHIWRQVNKKLFELWPFFSGFVESVRGKIQSCFCKSFLLHLTLEWLLPPARSSHFCVLPCFGKKYINFSGLLYFERSLNEVGSSQ